MGGRTLFLGLLAPLGIAAGATLGTHLAARSTASCAGSTTGWWDDTVADPPPGR